MYNEFEGVKTACISLEISYIYIIPKAAVKTSARAQANSRIYNHGLFPLITKYHYFIFPFQAKNACVKYLKKLVT